MLEQNEPDNYEIEQARLPLIGSGIDMQQWCELVKYKTK